MRIINLFFVVAAFSMGYSLAAQPTGREIVERAVKAGPAVALGKCGGLGNLSKNATKSCDYPPFTHHVRFLEPSLPV